MKVFIAMSDQKKIINIVDDTIKKYVNENEEIGTVEKLLNTAEKDGHITGMEATAQYILHAAKEIAAKWDQLDDEEKKIFRDTYYNNFLKKIHKI